MAEKLYHEIRDESGTIHISHSVIAEIAAIACLEVEGVASMSAAEKSVKGIVFTQSDDACTIDAHIFVKIGSNVTECAESAQLAIKNAVESSSGLDVKSVNVFVAGISLK